MGYLAHRLAHKLQHFFNRQAGMPYDHGGDLITESSRDGNHCI
jgi:hypothetical protein